MTDPRRYVPRTDAVLADPRLVAAARVLGRQQVKALVNEAQQRARRGEIEPGAVADVAAAAVTDRPASLRPVVNATGVVLHTNLGRAALSAAAIEAVVAAAGTTDVELDLGTGRRAARGRGALAALAAAVPEAGAVHVVNNGAAALVLAATALAGAGAGAGGAAVSGGAGGAAGARADAGGAGREIVVSRGELVEIGDGFRLPDLLESTGARLREVGTTNRTTLADYADAVGPDTAFVLKVHPSNFVVTGFTAAVPVSALSTLDVRVVVDIGSGLLAPDPMLPDEPDAATALRAGAALVTASGDKLLGGPQAGLLLGDSTLVEQLRRHPLARALRVDKLTLAALEATLRRPDTPTRAALRADVDDLRARALRLASAIGATESVGATVGGSGPGSGSATVTASGSGTVGGSGYGSGSGTVAASGSATVGGVEFVGGPEFVGVTVVASESVVGGGGAPGVTLPSWAVALPESYAEPLRRGDPPVVGRVERGRLLLDLRTVPSSMDDVVADAVRRLRG